MDTKAKLLKCFVDNFTADDRDLFTLIERITDKKKDGGGGFRIREFKIQYQKQMDPQIDIPDTKLNKVLADLRAVIKQENVVKENGDPVRKFYVGNEIIKTMVHETLVSRRSVLFEVEIYLKTVMKE